MLNDNATYTLKLKLFINSYLSIKLKKKKIIRFVRKKLNDFFFFVQLISL